MHCETRHGHRPACSEERVSERCTGTDAVAEIDRWVAWEQAEEARTSSFLAAARDNDLATLKPLVARDVNFLYVQDAAGCSALHRAVEGGHADVVAYLLKQGGLRLASLTTAQGLTARDLAVLQHKTAVAPQLQLHELDGTPRRFPAEATARPQVVFAGAVS